MKVSSDPGRFVCNFIYFKSLMRAAAHNCWHALFVHVPPFAAVKEEVQQQFAISLLGRISGLPALQGIPTSAPSTDAEKRV